MNDPSAIALVSAIILLGGIGGLIGSSRGRPGAGLLCGLILGPIGWIVAMFLPRGDAPASVTRRPGAPTRRTRHLPKKPDPFEEWSRRQGHDDRED